MSNKEENAVCFSEKRLIGSANLVFSGGKVVTLGATHNFFNFNFANDPLLSAKSIKFLEQRYFERLMDPNGVHKSWKAFFTNLKKSNENFNFSPTDFGTSTRAPGVRSEIGVTTSHPQSLSEECVADNTKLQEVIS